MMRQTKLPYRVHRTLQEAAGSLKAYRSRLEAAGLDLESFDAIELHKVYSKIFLTLQWSRGDRIAKEVK